MAIWLEGARRRGTGGVCQRGRSSRAREARCQARRDTPHRPRARVEHPFRVVTQQFGYTKTRYRGLAKSTAKLTLVFALRNG